MGMRSKVDLLCSTSAQLQRRLFRNFRAAVLDYSITPLFLLLGLDSFQSYLLNVLLQLVFAIR